MAVFVEDWGANYGSAYMVTSDDAGSASAELLEDGPERARQLAALARVPAALQVEGCAPSEAAARIVLDYADNGRGWPRRGL